MKLHHAACRERCVGCVAFQVFIGVVCTSTALRLHALERTTPFPGAPCALTARFHFISGTLAAPLPSGTAAPLLLVSNAAALPPSGVPLAPTLASRCASACAPGLQSGTEGAARRRGGSESEGGGIPGTREGSDPASEDAAGRAHLAARRKAAGGSASGIGADTDTPRHMCGVLATPWLGHSVQALYSPNDRPPK